MAKKSSNKDKKHPPPFISDGTQVIDKKGTVQKTIDDKSWITEFPEKTRQSWEKKFGNSIGNEGCSIKENNPIKTNLKNHNRKTCTILSTKKNKNREVCTMKTSIRRHGTTKGKNMVQGSRVAPKKMPWFFDDANKKILEAIANGHIQEHIIKNSSISKNATISRLKRMVQEKVLEKNMVQDEIDINKTHIVYKQTKACTKLLIGDEDEAQHQDFKSHEQKYKFELIQDEENLKIVNLIPCVNLRKLKNNTFKDFYMDSGNTIRLTSKHICFFSNTRLEADGIDNLNIKYVELAKAEVRKFSLEYGIRYNPVPTKYQPSTFDCISAEPFASVLRERGNFNIKSAGIEARVDPSDKGIESNEDNAREIEYRLFKMPIIIKDLQQAMIEQTKAIEKLTSEHKQDTVQLQEFIKTIGENQIQINEAVKIMSKTIKKITDIIVPNELKQESPQASPDRIMYG